MNQNYKQDIVQELIAFRLTRTSNLFYIDDYFYIAQIKEILEDHFIDLKITNNEIFHWLVMLDYNKRLEKLLISIYFRINNLPIDFDLSSFSKFRDKKNYDVYRNTHYRRH